MISFQHYLHRLRPIARNLLWWAVEGFEVSRCDRRDMKRNEIRLNTLSDSISLFYGLLWKGWTEHTKLLTSSSAVGVASRKPFKMGKSNSVSAQAIKRFKSVFEMEPIGLMSYVNYRVNAQSLMMRTISSSGSQGPDSAYGQKFRQEERSQELWLTADEQSYFLERFWSQHWTVLQTLSRLRTHP